MEDNVPVKKKKVMNSFMSSDRNKGVVSAVGKKDGNKRVYDKRHACLFCGFLSSKISKHLINMHSNEPSVARILAKPKKSPERKGMWTLIRNRGNFEHNIKALTTGGSLIVDRRPSLEKPVDDFLPCPYCLAFIVKDDIWRHTKNCPFVDVERDQRSVKKAATLLLEGSVSKSDDEMLAITNGMKNDEVTECLKNDSLLCILGTNMLRKVGKDRIANVRQKLRELGRLLLVLNTLNSPVKSFFYFISPENFDVVLSAVKKLCNSEKGETMRGCEKYELPSLALKLGHSLKKLAQIKVGQTLRKNDEVGLKEATNYLKLHDNEYGERISSQALNTLAERKFNQENVLPLTEDIVCVREYILKETQQSMKQLEQFPETGTWRKLAYLVLCRVCIFNRRRGGEVGAMLVETYSNRCVDESKGCKELVSSLQPIEQKLMERLQLVEIMGKRSRKVPVILTPDMIQGIDCLIKYRESVNVNSSNKYIFAAPSTANSYLKGWDALNSVCQQIPDLKMPHLIKTTKLRKYVATVSQLIDMGQNDELEWLASHMGHSLSVHRSFYRLQERTLELAKVSKLLMAVDRGVCHKFAGKTLDQMSLEDIEDIPEDEETEAGTFHNIVEEEAGQEDSIGDIEEEESNTGDLLGQEDSIGDIEEDESNTGDLLGAEEGNSSKAKTDNTEEQENFDLDAPHIAEISKKKEGKKIIRRQWNNMDKTLLGSAFHRCFLQHAPPTKNEILSQGRKCIKIQNMIEERGWHRVKYAVWSMVQQHKKKTEKVLNK